MSKTKGSFVHFKAHPSRAQNLSLLSVRVLLSCRKYFTFTQQCTFLCQPALCSCLVKQYSPSLRVVMQRSFRIFSRNKPAKPAPSFPQAFPTVNRLRANPLRSSFSIKSETVCAELRYMDPAVKPSEEQSAMIISTPGINRNQDARKNIKPCKHAISAKIQVRLTLI